LGLAFSPFLFIAVGAPSNYPPMFSVVMLPPVLLGCGFLILRYLSKSTRPSTRRRTLWAFEGLSWIAIGVFLFFVSNFNFMTPFERVGVVSIAFLVSTAAFVPIALLRATALEGRLGVLSNGVAIALLLLMLLAASSLVVVYLNTPSAFP
jgi:apolipoprotein N-acyltransferase